jgi:multidrug efflux system membrane fusion protein
VQAYNTVTIKARVDGHLDQVAFTEGQIVTAGAVLAQIDPRPFQAQLAQARAAKTRDEAQLANIRLDLERSKSLVAREFASRQTVDTQRSQVAQLEASVLGDQAAIDSAEIQLGYTTIVSPSCASSLTQPLFGGGLIKGGIGASPNHLIHSV